MAVYYYHLLSIITGVATLPLTLFKRLIQKDILKKQKKIQAFYNDTVLLNKIINRSYTEKQLDNLVEKDYFIFIYKVTPFECTFSGILEYSNNCA